MSDEKKIAKYEKAIRIWITELENNYRKLEKTDDPKKRNKLEEKIKKNLDHLQANVDYLEECGGSAESVFEAVSDSQKEIVRRFYATQPERDQAEVEKEIARIKKMLHQDLVKAREKYDPYEPDAPIEERYKSKLFQKEADIGRLLLNAGDEELKDNSFYYRECWNYTRDFASTKDEYFTLQEQQDIEWCVQVRQEEEAYMCIKNAKFIKLGESLMETAEKMDAWGDLAQAKFWVKNLYQDACPVIIREMYGKLPKAEEEQRSKEMTRRYLEFLRSEEQITELNRIYADTEKEAEELKMKLKTFSFQNDDFLSKKNDREIQELIRIMEQDVDGQNLLVLYLLRERIGMEKTAFISQYKYDPILNTRKELLNKFSIEELGL